MRLLKRKIDKSISIIKKMLSVSNNPYLALSFGKDSLVMLDLVRKIKPDVNCLFLKSEESYLLYDYENVINQYLKKGLNLEIVDTKRLSENNFDWSESRKAGKNDFLLNPFFNNWDGIFMGLRIEESKARRITLIKKDNNVIGDKIMQYKTGKRKGMYRCCPVAHWTEFEIMLYLNENKLPFLDVYKNGSHIRTTARLTGDAARQHSLFWVKQNNPENFNKLLKMIPELRHYL